MKLAENASAKKCGRVRRVPLTSPVRCPDCDGMGWPVLLVGPGIPSPSSRLDWDWPCQTCDTEGEVEGDLL